MRERVHANRSARRITDSPVVAFAVVLLLVALAGNLGVRISAIADTIWALLRLHPDSSLVNRDFVNYWFAAKLTLAGEHDLLFQPDAYFKQLDAFFGGGLEIRAWSYPPHALLFVWPLAFLPYPLAFLVFSLLGLAFYLYAVRRFLAASPLGCSGRRALPLMAVLLLPFITAQFVAGQNGFWFAGIILLALALRDTRPWSAGFLVALLSLKPQLAVLMPVLLLAERRWTVIFAAAIGTLVLLALAAAVFGIEPFVLFATVIAENQKAVMIEWVGGFLRLMPTPFAFLRLHGVAAPLAVEVNLVFSALMLVVAVIYIVRTASDFRRSLIFLAAAPLVSPYFFFYDMGALICGAVIVACLHRERPHGPGFAIFVIAATVCFLPWIMPVLSTIPVVSGLLQALPFVALLAFFLLTLTPRTALTPVPLTRPAASG